jgi:hypothetical protein
MVVVLVAVAVTLPGGQRGSRYRALGDPDTRSHHREQHERDDVRSATDA